MSLYTHPGGQVTLLPPPDGYISDFENPQRQYVAALYWASGVLSFIAVFCLFQRLYTNVVVEKKFLVEDAFLFIGWALIVLEVGLILNTVAKGAMGTHAYELELEDFLQYLKDFYPMPIVYPLCLMFAKLSLIVFFSRLSPAYYFKIACWFGMFFVSGSGIGLTFATAFPCRPLEKAWNPLITGTCIDQPATYKATAILGLLADVYIIILPIPTVVGLQLPWQQKAGLIIIFGVGIFTIVTSILRLYFVIQQLSDADISWGSGPVAFWLVIEAYLMVICATFPSLYKFFRHIAPKLIGERGSSNKNTGNSGNSGNNYGIVTFGGSGAKKNYRQFHDDVYGLEDMNQEVNIKSDPTERESRRQHDTSADDGDSSKGILQTRTVTVQYQQ